MVMMMLAKLPPKSLRKTTNPSPSFSSHNDLEMTPKKVKIRPYTRGFKLPSDFYNRLATFRVKGKKSPTFSKKSRLFQMNKSRDFFPGKSRQGEKIADFYNKS
jgi:hypothetical protein